MPDRWLTDGEVVRVGSRALDVVETPGHTQGHIVFHDREASLLYAGDHVLPTITPSIGFEPVSTRSFEELDRFNQVLAVGETGAHLALLEAQGRLRRTLEDGTFRYCTDLT